jgi:hypothetical protein
MVELRIYSTPRGEKAAADEELLGHLLQAFEELRSFVRETAASGAGAVAYLT